MPERISIRAGAVGTVNMISAYPGAQAGSFDNKRGMGFKLLAGFFDEWAFFSPQAQPSLLPIFANGAALIIATSVAMGGARAGTMKILDATYPDGKRAVLEVNMIQGCTACRAKGEPERCKHITPRPQHFTRRVHQRRLQALMAPFEGSFERELLNQNDRPSSMPCFDAAAVKLLAERKRDVDVNDRDHRAVYVVIDPHAGGFSQQVCLSVLSMNVGLQPNALVVRFTSLRAGASAPPVVPCPAHKVREHALPLAIAARALEVARAPAHALVHGRLVPVQKGDDAPVRRRPGAQGRVRGGIDGRADERLHAAVVRPEQEEQRLHDDRVLGRRHVVRRL